MRQSDGLIFDIQDFSVQDGPGIRTTIFLKGCPLRCRWCANPEGQERHPELVHSSALCRGCLQCLPLCPMGAITKGAQRSLRFQRRLCNRCQHRPCVDQCHHRAIRIAGQQLTVQQVIDRIDGNRPFYRNSGGGITLSGGEPLSQPYFVREFLDHTRSASIPVGLETCGHFHWNHIKSFITDFEFIYFDVKSLDDVRHRRATGQGNQTILKNLVSLSQIAADRITISVPVIPGFNEDERQIHNIATFVKKLSISRMRLLPYHAYGWDKYCDLGRKCEMSPDIQVDQEALCKMQDVAEKAGIECWVE